MVSLTDKQGFTEIARFCLKCKCLHGLKKYCPKLIRKMQSVGLYE